MANIADNLKRLLGTEGHNIQEVLENADSIGGNGIPYIEFVIDSDDIVVGDVRGINDVSNYTGPCFVKFTDPNEPSSANSVFLGTATGGEVDTETESGSITVTVYGIHYMHRSGLVYTTFSVGAGSDIAVFNQFALGNVGNTTPGDLTPIDPTPVTN